MPVVKGRYEIKISETYSSPKEGLAEIRKRLEKARKVRINSIPMKMLYDLKPDLESVPDLKIILPRGKRSNKELRELGDVATTKAKVYKVHKGKEINAGYIGFTDVMFYIDWNDKRVLNIRALYYGKCVKCMNDGFEGAWRYARKG